MTSTTKGQVAFVGLGPGDPDLLTLRAVDLLGRADVIVCDTAPPQAVSRHFRDGAAVTDFSAAESGNPAGRTERAKYLVDAAKSGAQVVRLVEGDPLLDTSHDEIAACVKAHIGFEIVPAVPAATGIPAYAGIPLVDSRHHEIRIIDVRTGAPKWAELGKTTATTVLIGVDDIPGAADALMSAGRSAQTPVAVTHGGTTTAQHTVVATLDSLAAEVKAAGLPSPVVMVVGDVVKHRANFSWFEAKPLFGWRVLVPRTKEQAAALSEKLRAHGAIPVEVPTISVEPPRTPQQMDRAIRGLVTGRYEWLALTSANAVRAVLEKFEEYGLDARAFSGIKIAAVGEQTAAILRAHGIKPDLVPTGEQSAAGLLADFPPYDKVLDPINRVLLPRADIATETLVAGLVELGWEVEDVTAYRTVRAAPPPAPIREAIKTGGFDAVCFTSSSTVRNLVGIAGKPHASTVIACIGPQTAKAAEEHGLRVDVLAPEPSMTALVDALAEFGLAQREAAIAAGEWTGKPGRPRVGHRRRAR